MPYLVRLTVTQVDAYLSGSPTTTAGVLRHYQIVPPANSKGPWSPSDIVASQVPDAGTCSETSPDSTLYLKLP
jgi:hypothetical protein